MYWGNVLQILWCLYYAILNLWKLLFCWFLELNYTLNYIHIELEIHFNASADVLIGLTLKKKSREAGMTHACAWSWRRKGKWAWPGGGCGGAKCLLYYFFVLKYWILWLFLIFLTYRYLVISNFWKFYRPLPQSYADSRKFNFEKMKSRSRSRVYDSFSPPPKRYPNVKRCYDFYKL